MPTISIILMAVACKRLNLRSNLGFILATR
jgi:hypothetical protein